MERRERERVNEEGKTRVEEKGIEREREREGGDRERE